MNAQTAYEKRLDEMEEEHRDMRRAAAAYLGRIRSKKKAKASRQNGKLGGRPRTRKQLVRKAD